MTPTAADTMAAFDREDEYALRALLMAMLRKHPGLVGFAYFGAAKALEEGEA